MRGLIGSTDGMGEPGSEAWAKVTGLATAAVIAGEGRVRGQTDRVRQQSVADRQARAAEQLRAAADTAGTANARAVIGGREKIPDPRTLTQMWIDAVNTPNDPGSVAQMQRAERFMRITQPELMQQYDAARARGIAPTTAMSHAMTTAHRNPTPADTTTTVAPTQAATAHAAPAAPASTRLQQLTHRLTGRGAHP